MLENQEILRPANTGELCEIVAEASASKRAIEIRAGGTKRDIGYPGRSVRLVDMNDFTGIVDYEPSELVLTARPATRLAEVEALLASRGQMLAFEPWDHGPLFGRTAREATIGGVVAAGVAGPRRVSAGGPRDHLLGFSAISGRAEFFKGGGKVVKNVTGYDVPKIIAGSWGRLAVMTELTLKVVPSPKAVATLVLSGLTTTAAIQAMAKALGSSASPAAAAHLPSSQTEVATTAIRVEGFAESVAVRTSQLLCALADFAPAQVMDEEHAKDFWTGITEARALAPEDTVWRIHTSPSRAAKLVEALERSGAAWLADWGGALVWAGAPAHVDIPRLAEANEAHTTLVRGPLELRGCQPGRHSEAPAVAALSARLKKAFDPAGILDPQRFG